MAAVKRFTRQIRARKQLKAARKKEIKEVSSLLFSVFKTVSVQNGLQIDWFSVNRKILQFRAFKSTCFKTLKSAKPGELMRHAQSTANTSKFSASRQKSANIFGADFKTFPGFRDLAQLCCMPPCQLSYPSSFAS